MKALLQSVSRSFYLTIKFLPRALRDPISLAYLLARATDTIADTAGIAAETRLTNLLGLARVIAGDEPFATIAAPLRDFAQHQSDPHERRLLEQLPEIIAWLERITPANRADIRVVLRTIVRGQELDLRRFAQASPAVRLQTAAELEEYTYLVAGCVGEFWTSLGFRCLLSFARRSPNEMTRLGIEYGKGLQLINVLRDRAVDEKNGRGYLPADELARDSIAQVQSRWLDEAEAGISSGIDYATALTNWRTRFATALPALIGARAIALLRVADEAADARHVKVPRAEVRRILLEALRATASPVALRALYQRLLSPPR